MAFSVEAAESDYTAGLQSMWFITTAEPKQNYKQDLGQSHRLSRTWGIIISATTMKLIMGGNGFALQGREQIRVHILYTVNVTKRNTVIEQFPHWI